MVSFWNATRMRKARFLLVILLLSLPTTAKATLEPFLGLLFSLLTFFQDVVQSVLEFFGIENFPYGTCADCFCIPSPGETCPADVPPTNFDALVPELRSLRWSNPYRLDCDPTQDPTCDTTPPLETGGACVVEFSAPPDSSTTCPDNWSYTVSTFPGTLAEAQADSSSLYVTHGGPCGTCSSLQDLAVYMELGPNLRDRSFACGVFGRLGREAGIDCFRDIGLTEACATAWYYNTVLTDEFCLGICLTFGLFNLPPNGHPPQCELAECLQCDEDNAGPTFAKYAGRTRRNSGLLTNIVRPCSQLLEIEHPSPCGVA